MAMGIVADMPGGPEVLQWVDFGATAPGPSEVLVRHTAIGVNFIDTYYRSGLYPWPGARLVPGSEAAGRVAAVGSGVVGLNVGDRVAYTAPLGAYCEERVIAADRVVRLPDALDDEVAASVMLKGLTAHYLVTSTFAVQAGHTVLVHAASGGVGLLLGQWLRHLGATTIGTVGSEAKAQVAREHGYDHVIDYTRDDFAPAVRAVSHGRGCDVVYDSVGQSTWRGSLKCLRPMGAFVSFGQSSGAITGFSVSDLAKGSLSVTRPTLFDYIASRAELQRRADALFGGVVDGWLQARPQQRAALRDAAQVHVALESRATIGATILLP